MTQVRAYGSMPVRVPSCALALGVVLTFVGHALAQTAGGDAGTQSYKYTLELGTEDGVCGHMGGVYNKKFRQPWLYDTFHNPPPWFPPLLEGQQPLNARLGLFSRFPESEEFNAIDWKETSWDREKGSSVLVANFDIDNDGVSDLVLKNPLMSPTQQGAWDSLVVLESGQVDLSKPLNRRDVYSRPEGPPRPALINYMTIGFPASWIRPFRFNGKTYLSVHQDWPKLRILVLMYEGGGRKVGQATPGAKDSPREAYARPWQPLRSRTVCRFRIIRQ